MKLASGLVPHAAFTAATAEFLPVRPGPINLVTAAGSLNWSDPTKVFPEIQRVLAEDGFFVLYDFGQGSESPTAAGLAEWHEDFKRRYPSPRAREIRPEALATESYGLRLTAHHRFEIAMSLSPESYLEHGMTETNVAEAIPNGTPEAEIRLWCRQILAPAFQGKAHDVLFVGYVAYFVVAWHRGST